MKPQYPLGIFSWFGFVLPFQERIKLIKEAGFAATSIWWEDEDTPWRIKKESMPQLVREMGLLLENIHVPFNESGALWAEQESVRYDVPYILDKIQSNYLGFCYDSSHYNLSDKQDFYLLEKYGERLVTTHLSDNDGLKDRHWLPGHGTIDWAMVAKHFPASYQGCLTLEAYPTTGEREDSPQIYLKRAYQKVKNVRDLIAIEGLTR